MMNSMQAVRTQAAALKGSALLKKIILDGRVI
jgi:hypothetical protein